MMRYCFAHHGSLGFVISQDGEIRAMTRVGARLIIWENLEVLSVTEPVVKKGRTPVSQVRRRAELTQLRKHPLALLRIHLI